MDDKCAQVIEREFRDCIINTIRRLEGEETHRPFHEALLSKDALYWSRFERSFSTSFGQRVVEKISKLAAIAGGASEAANQRETPTSLTERQLQAIDAHIGAIRNGRLARSPDWPTDLADVIGAGSGGQVVKNRVISDLWFRRDGVDNYVSIKTVKPNIDQTAEAKRDLLKLKLNDPSCNVYFGLYYNPYGERREDYAWSPPRGVFNFQTDAVVLIGREYWDTLGGDGFYDELIRIAAEVGEETRKRLLGLNR